MISNPLGLPRGSTREPEAGPAKVIQELAGHADLTTTMRYMHLANGSKQAAIEVSFSGAAGMRDVSPVPSYRSGRAIEGCHA